MRQVPVVIFIAYSPMLPAFQNLGVQHENS